MERNSALSSDEVNFLIYRYLLEAGFTHSAFTFGCESTVDKVNIDGKDVPIGALVSFIQKGFQFMELEANLTEDGTDVYAKYTSLSARDILTKDLKELRELTKDMKGEAVLGEASVPAHADGVLPPLAPKDFSTIVRQLQEHSSEILAMSWSPTANLLATCAADGTVRIWNSLTTDGAKGTQCAPLSTSTNSENSQDETIIGLEWSPDGNILAGATASGALAFWYRGGSLTSLSPSTAAILAMQWSNSGKYIATGGADGTVTLWNPSKCLQSQQWTMPTGAAIFDLHWKDDDMLAAASEDGCVAFYSISSSEPIRSSKEHGTSRLMDEDGVIKSQSAFLGASSPDTINMVRWSPSGRHLASASNDMSVGLWNIDTSDPPLFLTGHKREVLWVSWSAPQTGDNGDDEDHGGQGRAILASASSDGSVRLWNTQGMCIGVLDRHEEGITCVAWNNNNNNNSSSSGSGSGLLLATGDGGGNVTVWKVENNDVTMTKCTPGNGHDIHTVNATVVGRLPGHVNGGAQVLDVQWANNGTALVVAFAGSSAITVLNI